MNLKRKAILLSLMVARAIKKLEAKESQGSPPHRRSHLKLPKVILKRSQVKDLKRKNRKRNLAVSLRITRLSFTILTCMVELNQ